MLGRKCQLLCVSTVIRHHRTESDEDASLRAASRVPLDVQAHSYPNRPQVLLSLRAYLSTPQSLRISTRALSVRSCSVSVPRLSRCIRSCPGRLGTTSSIPISFGASGACVCHPVGEHAGVASHDTAFYLPPAEQPSVFLHKFVGVSASVAFPASSSTFSCTTSTEDYFSSSSEIKILCRSSEKFGYARCLRYGERTVSRLQIISWYWY